MTTKRPTLIFLMIAGILTSGCRTNNPHDHGGRLIAEYRPGWRPRERKAPYSTMYVLWAWSPTRTASTTRPFFVAKGPWERAFQMQSIFAYKGDRVGFRINNGSLIAVAGQTKISLASAHYCWHLMPGEEDPADSIHEKFGTLGAVILAVSIVGILVLVARDDN